MNVTAKEFWETVSDNELTMGEGAALAVACEMYGIEYGDWPEDDEEE